MPTPARISVPVKQSTPVKPTAESTPKTPASIPRPKARVVHRRRARGRLGDTESDDELVREPHSDSDSESATSTLDSESISDSEPEPEPEPEAKAAVRILSPVLAPLVAAGSASPSSQSPAIGSAFPGPHDWSEMVAEENASGTVTLPVIDFADLSSHAQATISPPRSVPSPPPSVPEQPGPSQNPVATSSSLIATRKPGQSARQAYLTRLDNDPAYVPTLGQFWSHDDRLLEKDLRSLSGWWRGRWQGRGRGTRGRGGFAGGWGIRGMRGRGSFGNGNTSIRPGDIPDEELAAMDRAWTHDGFEEMKQADEDERQQYPSRGRGGFRRGRGGPKGNTFMRGGPEGNTPMRGGPEGNTPMRGGGSFASANRSTSPNESQTHLQSDPQRSPVSDTLKFGNGTRPWFAMKPERVWTKQFDAYLYFETQLKPIHNQGLGQGVRVKLPGMKNVNPTEGLGNEAVVVRLPQRKVTTPGSVQSTLTDPLVDKAIVVKLPSSKRLGKEREIPPPEDVITVPPPPMEDSLPNFHSSSTTSYEVRPAQEISVPEFSQSSPRHISEMENPLSQVPGTVAIPPDQPPGGPGQPENPYSALPLINDVPGPSSSQSLAAVGTQKTENTETVLAFQPSVLPSLQTMAPPFQPSPPYGEPFAYATSGLPPGIAVTEAGVTYEIATGRAVYLHTPPPPPPPPPMQPPMYNPRPMPMHHTHLGSVHFLPHHAHGHGSSVSMSVSPPAFLSSPPIFSLPRQSSRIEIRAPGEEKKERQVESERLSAQGRLTGSRLAVNVNAEPFTPASLAQPQAMGYYMADAQQQAFDDAQRLHQQSLYRPTSYYYPVGADGSTPYGYGQQYASVDMGQPHQYDTYGQESYPQQHAVYY